MSRRANATSTEVNQVVLKPSIVGGILFRQLAQLKRTMLLRLLRGLSLFRDAVSAQTRLTGRAMNGAAPKRWGTLSRNPSMGPF